MKNTGRRGTSVYSSRMPQTLATARTTPVAASDLRISSILQVLVVELDQQPGHGPDHQHHAEPGQYRDGDRQRARGRVVGYQPGRERDRQRRRARSPARSAACSGDRRRWTSDCTRSSPGPPRRSGMHPRPLSAIQAATGSAISSVVVEAWSITSNIPANATPRMAAAQHQRVTIGRSLVKLPCYHVKEARHICQRMSRDI